MKKILKGTTFALLLMLSFSCEKNESELNIESSIEQEKIIESNLKSKFSLQTTICSITGPSITVAGEEAIVSAGSTVGYSYTNNSGTPSSVNWVFTSLVPSGSATLSQSGSNVTVTFSSNFSSGRLSVTGSGGTADICQTSINIVEGTGPVLCTPVSSSVIASGPDFMTGATLNTVSWNYVGTANPGVSFRWWYQKVRLNGFLEAPKVIAYGSNPMFVAFPGFEYSDDSSRRSKFKIYLEVTDDCGNRYYSPDYYITKRGKYELGGMM